jgi:hypothetical protein
MPRPESTNSYPMVFPSQAVSFDPEAFDELIRNQGVQMIHYAGLRCPVGMTDPDDVMRRTHDHHADCSNGFLYTKAGLVTVSFMGNSASVNFKEYGRDDGSTVQVVLPRTYDDKPEKSIEMCEFDRLYPTDEAINVTNWHTFACHVSGVDRLQFPAIEVEILIDANNKRYTPGVDFVVRGGQIHWVDGVGPGIDPKTGKGVVCSIRYSYRPFWYVEKMLHEVRLAQIEDDFGNRSVQRMHQAALLVRERWFEKEQRDADAPTPNSPRQKPEPASGGFGPR